MDETLLIDATERFLNGQMGKEELSYFESLRANNPDVDQLVSEYIFFIREMEKYGDIKKLKHVMSDTFVKLTEEGKINTTQYTGRGKLVRFWNKYKKTTAVAASIAIVVSFVCASIISAVSTQKQNNIKPLVERIKKEQDDRYKKLEHQLGDLKSKQMETKPRVESNFRATGFLIDASNNLILTNAHVIQEAKNQIIIEKGSGEQFTAEPVLVIAEKDIAILRITDPEFKSMPQAPFSFSKSGSELGEPLFMLGYPKQEIVYGEGYLSAQNGHLMDTIFYQLSTLANEGNSGSPVLNKSGELIGVISSKEANAEGVVYAIKSNYILSALNDLKKMDGYKALKINNFGQLKKLDRTQQIKRLQDYVFMIKGN